MQDDVQMCDNTEEAAPPKKGGGTCTSMTQHGPSAIKITPYQIRGPAAAFDFQWTKPVETNTDKTQPLTPSQPQPKPQPQPNSQPQKSTSSASKAEKQHHKIEEEWLKKARAYVEKAHKSTPIYSEALQALNAAIESKEEESLQVVLRKQPAKQQPRKAPTPPVAFPKTPSYAAVAKKQSTALKTEKNTKPIPKAQSTVTRHLATENQLNMPTKLVVLLHNNEPPPTYSSMAIRDAINNSITKEGNIKGPVVGSVTTSAKGNIVLTTIPPHNAEVLRACQSVWQGVFQKLPVKEYQVQRPWLKLVAHGVPVEVGNKFPAECKGFNPVEVKGAVRWLKQPKTSSGSIVFSVDSQKEKQHCLSQGLFIAGKRVTVVGFKTHTQYSQCPRCQGFGHDPAKCRKRVACKFCGGSHFTKNHACNICQASRNCVHLTPQCVNCTGQHFANSVECEKLKAVRKR